MSASGTVSDVAIIGGGAIGTTIAYQLALSGMRPLLLERAHTATEGCSSGNAGLIAVGHCFPLATPGNLKAGLKSMLSRESPFSFTPRLGLVPWLARYTASCRKKKVAGSTALVRDLARRSLEMHAEIARRGIDTGFERRGVINVYETEKAFAMGKREAQANLSEGLRSVVMDPATARREEPSLSDAIAGAIRYPDEGHCDPSRYLLSVGGAAKDAGAEIRYGVEVLDIELRRGRATRLRTTAGDVETGMVIVAAGVWLRHLAGRLGIRIPLEGGKGYHVDLVPWAGSPRTPLFLQEGRVIVTPLREAVRLAGTLQLTGLDDSINRRRIDAVFATGARNLPAVTEDRIANVWRGLRPCPPDGIPVIGKTARADNVIFAGGHGMMGLHLAPITALLVQQTAAGQDTEVSLQAVSPDRFGSTVGRRRAI